MEITIVVGTRPEIIKMAPVIRALKKKPGIISRFVLSGQHTNLAWETLQSFQIEVNELVLNRSNDSLGNLTGQLIESIAAYLDLLHKQDLILVHGDTTTALAASIAAFYNKIPVGHVEAGLRTSRFEYPFPEEMNRRLISTLATYHFAPTPLAADNLKREGICTNVFVTGNTVVDSLAYMMDQHHPGIYNTITPMGSQAILVTCHRRESWGEPLLELCKAVSELAIKHKDYVFIWPVHPNPEIKRTVEYYLTKLPIDIRRRIQLHGNIGYSDFVSLLRVVDLAITDSGGVMEEAAVLGTPCLVLRTETERPEALELPDIHLVGYDFKLLKAMVPMMLNHPPKCPWFSSELNTMFGDGLAGERIAGIISGGIKI